MDVVFVMASCGLALLVFALGAQRLLPTVAGEPPVAHVDATFDRSPVRGAVEVVAGAALWLPLLTHGERVVVLVTACVLLALAIADLIRATTGASRGGDLSGPLAVGTIAAAVLCLQFSGLPSWTLVGS